ncbi:MAG: lipopolysaccharide biosynthesis protein [Acidimicrobiales bacterium]
MSRGPLDPPVAGAVTVPGEGGEGLADGIRWGLVDQGVQVAVRFATTVVLARLVLPEEFGLFGLVMIVTGLAQVLSGLGLGPALIQRRDITERHVVTAFTVSSGFGLMLTAVVAAAGWPASVYFHQPRLLLLIVAMSCTFVLRGLELIPNDLLLRKMRFRSYYLSSTIATVASSGLAIGAAVHGAGVWAFVIMAIAESFAATFIGWAFAIKDRVWSPRLGYNREAMRELSRFSAFLTADRLVGFGTGNADNIVVGRVLGASALGYYSLAYRVVLLPLQRFGEVVASSTYPALSAVQDDVERLRTGYADATQLISAVCFPLTIGFAVTAPISVPLVLGHRWVPAVATVQILALSGPVLSVNRLSGVLARAVGRVSWSLWSNVAGLAIYLPAFLIGAQHGITGVAVGFTIATTLTVIPEIWVAAKVLHQGWLEVLNPAVPVAVATAAMALVSSLALLLRPSLGGAVSLAVAACVGAIVYTGALRALAPSLFDRALGLLRRPRSRV